MNPKLAWERPGLAWLQRIEFHLTNAQSEALAADDVQGYETYGQSIRFITTLAYLIQREDRHTQLKKREKLARLRVIRNAHDPTLTQRLADCDFLAAA